MLQKEKCYMLNNGVEIPLIGFGTDYLRGEECINAVIHAIECGYRLIDTASVYKNEKEIGIAVKKCIERGIIKRSDIIIETKSHWFGPGYEEVLQSYRESLENFDLDYICLYGIYAVLASNYPNKCKKIYTYLKRCRGFNLEDALDLGIEPITNIEKFKNEYQTYLNKNNLK